MNAHRLCSGFERAPVSLALALEEPTDLFCRIGHEVGAFTTSGGWDWLPSMRGILIDEIHGLVCVFSRNMRYGFPIFGHHAARNSLGAPQWRVKVSEK